MQIVGAKRRSRSRDAGLRRWHEACLRALDGRAPKYGALWMTYFPNVMLEWYPNVLVVSHLIPRSPDSTANVVEFYYPEEIALFERDFVEAQQAAYVETAAEDDDDLHAHGSRPPRAMGAGTRRRGPLPVTDGRPSAFP